MGKVIEAFTITSVYADINCYSRLENISRELNPEGDIGFQPEPVATEHIIFRKGLRRYDYTLHTAPSRQYIILEDGEIEIETLLGEKHRFGTREILLMEDTTGKDHIKRNLKQPLVVLFS